jgi:hypothetical protein
VAFKENPRYAYEVEDDTPLWRYMDLAKFVSLLRSNSLYFTRLGVLAQSADRYEGALAQINLSEADRVAAQYAQMTFGGVNEPDQVGLFRKYFADPDYLRQILDDARTKVYVNCWHANSYESAAMWKLYLQGNEGIALRSTAKRFRESLTHAPDEQYLNPVHYYDPEREYVPPDLWLIPLYKRISFEHEREVRAYGVYYDVGRHFGPQTENGISIPCDVAVLIERVFVAPSAPRYVRDAVQEILKRFGLGAIPVEQSALDAMPGEPGVK